MLTETHYAYTRMRAIPLHQTVHPARGHSARELLLTLTGGIRGPNHEHGAGSKLC